MKSQLLGPKPAARTIRQLRCVPPNTTRGIRKLDKCKQHIIPTGNNLGSKWATFPRKYGASVDVLILEHCHR